MGTRAEKKLTCLNAHELASGYKQKILNVFSSLLSACPTRLALRVRVGVIGLDIL